MRVLRATQEQFELIDNLRSDGHIMRFEQDANNDWICSTECKTNSAYASIMVDDNGVQKSVLQVVNELEEIDYIPPIIES